MCIRDSLCCVDDFHVDCSVFGGLLFQRCQDRTTCARQVVHEPSCCVCSDGFYSNHHLCKLTSKQMVEALPLSARSFVCYFLASLLWLCIEPSVHGDSKWFGIVIQLVGIGPAFFETGNLLNCPNASHACYFRIPIPQRDRPLSWTIESDHRA